MPNLLILAFCLLNLTLTMAENSNKLYNTQQGLKLRGLRRLLEQDGRGSSSSPSISPTIIIDGSESESDIEYVYSRPAAELVLGIALGVGILSMLVLIVTKIISVSRQNRSLDVNSN